ncbi:MAG: hypothetical protein ABL936_00495 [Aestuariivirga sp.]
MALQFSTAVRNAMLDAIETATGATAVLKIRTGAAPANCAAADSGTVVATITLAADWAAAAASGQKSFANLPITDASADADGTAAHWRLYASDGVTCHAQGTYGVAGTDIVGDSVSFTTGQTFNITAWTWTAPGA